MYGWGLIKGLAVTMRHFVTSFTYDRKPWEPRYSKEWLDKHQAIDGKGIFTIQYPEQQRKITETFRFHPMLIYEETPDQPRCTACGICARVCPTQCIWIQRATDDKGRPRAQPAGFWIDQTICMSCGYCTEFCPFDAIKMDQDHETVHTDRDKGMFLDMPRLLHPVEYYAQLHPTDYAREEAARQAKEEAKRKAAEAKAAPAAEEKSKPAPPAKPVAKEKAEAAPPPSAEPAAQEKGEGTTRAPAQPVVEAKDLTPQVPAEATPPTQPDNLEIIEGIGPKFASVLRAAGITTFAKLADTDEERIRQILQEASPNLLRLARTSTWAQQARMAANGEWEALERWQAELKGGEDK
jgi:NADH-quinone oxidoreductase subunit I